MREDEVVNMLVEEKEEHVLIVVFFILVVEKVTVVEDMDIHKRLVIVNEKLS